MLLDVGWRREDDAALAGRVFGENGVDLTVQNCLLRSERAFWIEAVIQRFPQRDRVLGASQNTLLGFDEVGPGIVIAQCGR